MELTWSRPSLLSSLQVSRSAGLQLASGWGLDSVQGALLYLVEAGFRIGLGWPGGF